MEKVEKISMKPQMVFSPQPMYIIGTRNENRPAIYAPYQYFSIGEKLGEMGEWKVKGRE